MAILALEEAVDSLSPSVGSLSAEDGQTTRTWRTPLETPVVNPGDVLDTENWLVGYTNTAVNTAKPGALNRAPPLADPHRPNWFVRKLNSTRGVVNRDRVNTEGFNRAANKSGQVGLLPTPNEADITRSQPVLSQFALYCTYEFSVSCGPRPYPVAGDDAITVYSGSDPATGMARVFYWPDRLTQSPYLYADEWRRFTTRPHFAAQNDYVTAQQGAYVFRCAGGAAPNGYVFTGMPRVHLRTSVVTMTWYAVPLRYVLSPNSFIRRFRGLVNQYPWYESPSDPTKKVFGSGRLLYLNYDYTDYESPLNTTETAFPGYQGAASTLMAPQLCNVVFTFLHAERKATNPIVPAWGGWVTDGHNALPYLGLPGQFFYATGTGPTVFGVGDPNSWFPQFSSFPFELLFTDPDAAQPAGFPPQGGGGV